MSDLVGLGELGLEVIKNLRHKGSVGKVLTDEKFITRHKLCDEKSVP